MDVLYALIESLKEQGFSVTLLAYFSYFFYNKNIQLEKEIRELREKYELFMQNMNEELKDVVHKNTAILEKVSERLKKEN